MVAAHGLKRGKKEGVAYADGKEKPFWPLIILGAFMAVFVGYLAGGAWSEDATIFTFLSEFAMVIQSPFRNYFNQYTFNAIVITLVLYALIMLMYYTSQRNYMPGKEYGTAKFISP